MKIAIKHRTNNCKDYMGSHPVVVITDKELWCSRVASLITRLIVMCLFSVYISRQAKCWHRRVQWWYGDRWSGDSGKATWWHHRWTWCHPVTEQRTFLTLLYLDSYTRLIFAHKLQNLSSKFFCDWHLLGWWGTTPCTWNFGLNWPHSCKNADFQFIFAHSTSAITRSKKVQSSLIGSPLRAFHWA